MILNLSFLFIKCTAPYAVFRAINNRIEQFVLDFGRLLINQAIPSTILIKLYDHSSCLSMSFFHSRFP